MLVLNEEKGIALSPAAFPDLLEQVGKQLVVTDGTTLLGADDKAGVAEIFAAVERLVRDPRLAHGRVAVCITPDEEVGRGADYVDLARLGAAFAYTVDGGPLGTLEYENFNAAAGTVLLHGVNIHPGEGKKQDAERLPDGGASSSPWYPRRRRRPIRRDMRGSIICAP